MPLYDITHGVKSVKPSRIGKYDTISALERKCHPRTFERVLKTFEEGVEAVVQNGGSNRLIWTSAGALMGFKSFMPKYLVDHTWEKIIEVLGDGRECNWAVGSLLRYMIAKRPETWLSITQDTGKTDPITGEEITRSEYWVNEKFVPKK